MKTKIFHRLAAILLSAALLTTSLPPGQAAASEAPPEPERVSAHDPSILKANGTYYLFGSHLADAKSTDLIHWTQMNPDWNARDPKDSWKQDSVYGNILTNLSESFAWAGYDDGDMKNGSVMSGQIAGLVKEELTCKELMERLVKETDEILTGAKNYA